MAEISIVTYNVLAQRWVDPYVKERYGYVVNLEYLSWQYRRQLIVKELMELDSDVICLQEIELGTFEEDFSELLSGYDYVKHIISNARTNPVGNVILWKRNKFSCEESLQRSSAVIVVLKGLGGKVKIANIHLKAGRETFEKERVPQLKSTLKKNPDVICGDFNDELEETGLLYPLLSVNYVIPVRHKSTSVYYAKEDKIFHNFWAFDHIVVKSSIGNIKINKQNLIEKIPDKNYPSDHILLYGILTIS